MEYEKNLCQDVRGLLKGDLIAEYFSDVEELRQHWQECEKCQASFPDGTPQFTDILNP